MTMLKIIKRNPQTNLDHISTVELGVKVWTFPAGEIGVKLDLPNPRWAEVHASFQTIIFRPQSSADILALLMTVDALRRLDSTPIRLFMPYCPYGRQDRACVSGEAFSLGVFARLINGLNLETVTTLDPHSSVTDAVFDRLTAISQKDIIRRWEDLHARLLAPNVVLVSPDAGANKKTADLASYLTHRSFIRADKLRNLETGEILETIVYADDLKGATAVIADDCADGARTFIELARALRAKGAGRIVLYVTHGIWSKGLDVVFAGGIDEVFCVDSFRLDIDSRVRVLRAETFL